VHEGIDILACNRRHLELTNQGLYVALYTASIDG
jgi:hypothetical protein